MSADIVFPADYWLSFKFKEAFILPKIPVTEVQKSWFAEPETSPNDSPTVRITLQEPKTVTQLRFFKLW